MSIKNIGRIMPFFAMFWALQVWDVKAAHASGEFDKPLVQVERRLSEETETSPDEANSLTYRRAIGELPARTVSPREMKAQYALTLDECLRLAFANSNEIEQARQRILAVGGSELIARSRFLPSIEIVSQYERFRDFGWANATDDASAVSAQISQRILEYGKDNPLDVSLRAEQRDALFTYENQVATVFSQVRKAFFFIKLKEDQIATRQELLKGFEKQHETKQQRMEAGNLSVKMEVLTARLNVLNERTRINTLERQRFNRKMDLLRLIGLPVGADQVGFEGRIDRFGLDGFDMDEMIGLALAQSSEVALVQAVVAEQQRVLDQIRYEYFPDLRLTGGYQDEDGRVGAGLINENDTWGLDVVGQPQTFNNAPTLGLFQRETALPGPDPGWFAGVQLRIPLFEGRAREGRRIRARTAVGRLSAALDGTKGRIELGVRQSYKFLMEQKFQVELAYENVNIERERFSIMEKLKDVGKITYDELETFRRSFFTAQDMLFREQEALIDQQEDLRLAIRYFK
jgi:outer membrane protein TolC